MSEESAYNAYRLHLEGKPGGMTPEDAKAYSTFVTDGKLKMPAGGSLILADPTTDVDTDTDPREFLINIQDGEKP